MQYPQSLSKHSLTCKPPLNTRSHGWFSIQHMLELATVYSPSSVGVFLFVFVMNIFEENKCLSKHEHRIPFYVVNCRHAALDYNFHRVLFVILYVTKPCKLYTHKRCPWNVDGYRCCLDTFTVRLIIYECKIRGGKSGKRFNDVKKKHAISSKIYVFFSLLVNAQTMNK